MNKVYILYKDSTTRGFYADDITDDLKTQILSENPGCSFSTNRVNIPEPNEDYTNVVFPHHVVVEEGVARVLDSVEIDEANQQNLLYLALNDLRQERNKKLEQTDWWAVGDRTMTQEQIDYRQALRDITKTYTSMEDVVWPSKMENN